MQITVPNSIGSNPLEIIIGGVNYYLGAGETVNVPDAVATELARMLAAMADQIKPVPAPFEQLPAVTASDNDKVLTVVEGAWAPAAAPSGLPSVSATDNGDVLTVVDGAWAKAAPSGGGGVTTYYITWDDVDTVMWAYKNEALSETVTVNEMIAAYTGGEIRFVMKYDGTVIGVYSCVNYDAEQDDAFVIAIAENGSFTAIPVHASSTRPASEPDQ